jgi:hypothetical protein
MSQPPPEVIGSAVTVAWLHRDAPLSPTGNLSLYVDGEPLEGVSAIIIAFEPTTTTNEVHHCDSSWRILAVNSGGPSLASTLELVASWYEGMDHGWVETAFDLKKAEQTVRNSWSEKRCSFCGRIPTDFESLIEAREARICDLCVREFSAQLRGDG